MKATIATLLALHLALLSCEKAENPPQEGMAEMYGANSYFSTKVRIVDNRGTDLLDKSNERHYTSEDIDLIEYIGKNAMTYQDYLDRTWRPGDPILDNKKGYSIVQRESYYTLSVGFRMKNMDDRISTRHLRIGKNGRVYALKGEAEIFRPENEPWVLYGGGMVILTKRIWLDGKLVWEAEKEEELPDGDRRFPEITIVVPD